MIINRELSEVFKLKYRMGLEVYPLVPGHLKGSRPFYKHILSFWFSNLHSFYSDAFPGYEWFLTSFIKKLSEPQKFQLCLSDEFKQKIPNIKTKKHTHHCLSSVIGDIFITKQGIEVAIKVVHKKTSEVLSIVDIFKEKYDLNTLNIIAENLSY